MTVVVWNRDKIGDDAVDSFHNNIGESAIYLEIHKVFPVKPVCGSCAIRYIKYMMGCLIIIDINIGQGIYHEVYQQYCQHSNLDSKSLFLIDDI